MNVLFIGNSFTYFNCLTGMLWNQARLNGKELNVEELTTGGYYLHQYVDKEDKHGLEVSYKLPQRKWDVVVLQDQSANPALDPEDFLAASRILCEEIRKAGAVPCFYQTWSYREGSEKLSSTGMGYEEFYEALKSSYEKAARENEAHIAPVGTAFMNFSRKHPEIDLFSAADDYHPTAAGTYLSMCTFFKTLFGEKPERLFVPYGLTEDICRVIAESDY